MAELTLDEGEPEDLETESEEFFPPVHWETHPIAGKHGLEVVSSVPEAVGSKTGEAEEIRERSQFSSADDGGKMEFSIPDVTKSDPIDACELMGDVNFSHRTAKVGSQSKMLKECEDESQREGSCSEVFPSDVSQVAMENPTAFHKASAVDSLEMEDPDMPAGTRTEFPQTLNNGSDVGKVTLRDTTAVEDTIAKAPVTMEISLQEVEPVEPNLCHKLNIAVMTTVASVKDDKSPLVRMEEVTYSITSAELGAVSNQNTELNQNIFGFSTDERLTATGANPQTKNKEGDGRIEDQLNMNFDVKGNNRQSRTTDDLPTGVKAPLRHVGHLVLDELTPTDSRRSYRSKRKHSNPAASSRHGDSRKRGDHRAVGGEELDESNVSTAEHKRRHEVLDSLAADACLFIPAVGDWHEVTSEGECHDAVMRKSSYLRAVKVSASQIGDAKVHRSTSYRIATARHQVPSSGEAEQLPNTAQAVENNSNELDPLNGSTRSDRTTSSHISKETTEPCQSDEATRKVKSDRRGSSHHSDHGRRPSLAKDLLLLSPTAVSAAQSWNETGAISNSGATDLASTPTKSSGIRRLKELFMEKSSPKDGSTVDQPHFVYEDNQEMLSSSAVVDGQLNCKNTMMDGKRSTDRAWKCVHAVLRGHHLYLHPDKTTQNVLVYEHPVSVKNALVDIAYDYVKRKNVFRLTTYNISEFLLEASDQESMLHWIRSIQECGYLSSDKEFSASRELIRQKRLMSRQASRSGANDSSHRKHSDSSRSPRLASKIPEPVGAPRTRKTSRDPSKSPQRDNQATDEETPRSPQRKTTSTILRHADNSEQKSKDVRTWKSKMVKKFKRLSSQSPATPSVEQLGAFGVELDKCVPSANNESVPLIVDACITIVESKGLTNKGIYRVPGNSAAITQLQAELNKDPTSINLESEKWQDVNAVISLLKLFFRELPDPLITKELYSSMIEANRVDDPTKRMLKIKRLLHHLPMHNFETFRFLACHLNKVASAGDVNMMDARNLAIVFGPTLLQPKQDMLNMVKDMSDQCRIVESIILHCDWFFSSWDEDVNVPADGEKDVSTVPITGMDQQLIEKAEHMVLEEQIQSNKKLWRPNAARKMNSKDRFTGSVSSCLDSNNERNIDEEILLRSGPVTDKKVATRNDGKNAKTRAQSVPPRPVSTLQVQPGKPVERMTETAPAKRKNSSPVTIQRRESAVPGGTGVARHQFHRSSSEASEKTYRVSSNTRGKQFGGTANSKATLFEQQANNRQRKSISSQALFNAKLVQSHKLSPGSTPRSSEEKLGSPHCCRGPQMSSSRVMLAGDLGDAKRKRASQHHTRTDGYGRVLHPVKSSVGSRKPDALLRRDGHSETRSVGTKQPELNRSKEDENRKVEEQKNLEPSKKDCQLDADKTDIRILEEPCLVLRQADSRKVWNSTNQKWEDLPNNKGPSSSPKRSPAKSSVHNNQTSPASSTRLNNENTALDRSTADASNDDGVNLFTEKSNVSLHLSNKEKTEDVPEITELSLEHQVVCEDKENHIEIVFSNNTENSIIRLSPVCRSYLKPDVSDGSINPGKVAHSCSLDSSPGDNPPTPQTMQVVLRRNHPDFSKSGQVREPHSQPLVSSLLISPNTDDQLSKTQQKDTWRHTLEGSNSNECELDPVFGNPLSKTLHRTSSEPSIRVSSPIIPQPRGSPKKETRPKDRRSLSASARSRSEKHHNTRPVRTGCLGYGANDRSRSLTYESSV